MEDARAPTRAAPMDKAMHSSVLAAASMIMTGSNGGGGGNGVGGGASDGTSGNARAADGTDGQVPLLMSSRAIHDAAPLASVMPSAMLFVPSIGGISHSFDEHTHDEDIVMGAKAYVAAAEAIVSGRDCSRAAAKQEL